MAVDPSYVPELNPGGASTLTIGGVDVRVKNWTVDKTYTLEDVTTTGDFDSVTGLTFARDLPVAVRDEISFEALVDASNDILATLEAGTAEVANVVVKLRTGKTRTYPLIVLTSINIKSGGVMGVNSYSIKAKSQGGYTTT